MIDEWMKYTQSQPSLYSEQMLTVKRELRSTREELEKGKGKSPELDQTKAALAQTTHQLQRETAEHQTTKAALAHTTQQLQRETADHQTTKAALAQTTQQLQRETADHQTTKSSLQQACELQTSLYQLSVAV